MLAFYACLGLASLALSYRALIYSNTLLDLGLGVLFSLGAFFAGWRLDVLSKRLVGL